ncbi:hypothetical protein TcBrA4_0041530 [Trypanosoma cruzi]|nr:hypothetical protein TcBrA4_0041530 [Trypanosoma cruzi]
MRRGTRGTFVEQHLLKRERQHSGKSDISLQNCCGGFSPASAWRDTRTRPSALIEPASTAQEENCFACSEDVSAASGKDEERLLQNRLFNYVRSRSSALVKLSGVARDFPCAGGSLHGSVKPLSDPTDRMDGGASPFRYSSSTDGHAGVASTVSSVDAFWASSQ